MKASKRGFITLFKFPSLRSALIGLHEIESLMEDCSMIEKREKLSLPTMITQLLSTPIRLIETIFIQILAFKFGFQLTFMQM